MRGRSCADVFSRRGVRDELTDPGAMTGAGAPGFDPVQYKETTREQWQETAEAWHRWGPTLEDWLG
jgi:hypothetical protein